MATHHYESLAAITEIELQTAPDCSSDGEFEQHGYSSTVFNLENSYPREGITSLGPEDEVDHWRDEDVENYHKYGQRDVDSPFLADYHSPNKPSAQKDALPAWMGWLEYQMKTPAFMKSANRSLGANIDAFIKNNELGGLTFTEKTKVRQQRGGATPTRQAQLRQGIQFQEEAIHAAPQVAPYNHQNGPVMHGNPQQSASRLTVDSHPGGHGAGGGQKHGIKGAVQNKLHKGNNNQPAKPKAAPGPPKQKKTFGKGIFKLLKDFWFLSALLVFVPIGVASAMLHWSDAVVFALNFMAIVPMAWLIGQCTEDIAEHLGQVYGGLVNAWMGNVVEMVLVVAALRHNEVVVVRATLIGSILSNILLVAGCSFLFGGIKYKTQEFNAQSAGILCSLLMLSVLCLGLPTVYNTVLDKADADLLQISRVLSFFLIITYAEFMFFQLFTHAYLFAEEEDGEEEDTYLTVGEAILILCLTTVGCTFSSEYLVRSIDGTVKRCSLSKEFIGIILLPIIGNAAEHYTAVVVSVKNKMDLSIGCAIGSSVQMALLVTPFSVLTGWAMGVPMTLDLHPYELMVLLASILTVQSIINDGKTNWLEGALLCTAYLVISIIYFLEDPKYSDLL